MEIRPNPKIGQETDASEQPAEILTLRFPNPLYSSPSEKTSIESTAYKGVTPHQTLGQIADKIQEQARAAKIRGSEMTGEDTKEDDVEDDDDVGDDEGDDEIGGQGTESTGRWTKQEHELFLEALKKFGKEWKKVASMVKTRTVVQTRTHAQKYFQKLAKGTGHDDVPGSNSASERKESKLPGSTATSALKKLKYEDITPVSLHHKYDSKASKSHSKSTTSDTPEAPSYYPLDNEQLQPYDQLSTPISSTFPQLFLPPPAPQDFPQPSPAACGKRKHIELKAAQMMASGGSDIDIEGAKLLSKMKEESIERSVNSGRRFRSADLSLSIMSPEGFMFNESVEPGTPWEKEISALSKERKLDLTLPFVLPTPSAQRQFLNNVRRFIPAYDSQGILDTCREVDARDGHSRDFIASSLNLPIKEDSQITVLMETILMDIDPSNFHVVYDICKVLLDFGVSASSIDTHGNTALHYAAEKGFERIGELLLTKGAHINAINKDGDAAVHIAAKEGHIPFLYMLVRLGANFHLRNGSALSPLDSAGLSSQDPGEREVLRKAMLSAESRLRTLVLFHQDFMEHTARRPSDWEGPDRLKSIMSRLRDRKEFPDYVLEISSQFEKADVELLGRVHAPEYLTFVNELSKQVRNNNDEFGNNGVAVPFTPQVQKHVMHHASHELKLADNCDTSFSAGTLNAARRATGAVAHAVDRVMLGRNRNAFCAIRPPGHHAGYRGLLDGADSCGFCIFNNVAAGALHALTEHQCSRVAIVDLDIHHGNGTEDIVRRYQHPSRLFFFSVHLFDKDPVQKYRFYPGTGSIDDHVHNVINVPILPLWRNPAITTPSKEKKTKSHEEKDVESPVNQAQSTESSKLYGKEAFRQAVSQRLIPSLRAFNPDLILLSMGFDAAYGDVGNCRHQPNIPIVRGMDLRPDDFAWATTEVLKIADICCNGKVVSVLEGGYGEYEGHGAVKQKTYSTRGNAIKKDEDAHSTTATIEIDANSIESFMNRSILADCAAAHMHRLIDPYGQAKYGSIGPAF